jgi:RimJ/RimL family protein N-acetyltransferase
VLEVPVLSGARVRLEPLQPVHLDGLVVAAAKNRDTYGWTTVPDGRDETTAYVDRLLAARAAGELIPFVQVSAADTRPVGMTNFLALRPWPDRSEPYAVEIGGTWLAASAQRTGINVEAKLLLLTYAFDVWRVGRVDFKTDARNQRSRDAIADLGATFEGVLRNWQPSHAAGEDGLLRDSALFSIVRDEWQDVRAGLERRLAQRTS